MDPPQKTYTVRAPLTGTPYLVDSAKPATFTSSQNGPRRVVYTPQPGPVQTPRVSRVLPPPQSAPQLLRGGASTPSNTSQAQLRYEFDFADSKRGGTDKSKGLRHFSTKVCEKVKEKGRTNYNEVADELVAEYFDAQSTIQLNDEKHQYDMKNIRRRVYDALNVLLAMNIIEKNKKDIHWVGLPTSTVQEFKRLEEDKIRRQERIREKTESLQEMIIQLVAYKTLVEKNRDRERDEGRPVDNSVLYLPYVIVNTEKRAMVECSVAHDKSEFLFNFDQPFEIHDDVEVLKRLGLAHGLERGEVKPEMTDKVKECLPVALRDYVDQITKGSMHVTQCDAEKPAQYVILDQQIEGSQEKTVSTIVHPMAQPLHRPPVVPSPRINGPPRYAVVGKQPVAVGAQSTVAKRYQPVPVSQNGGQRLILQAPSPVNAVRQPAQPMRQRLPQYNQYVQEEQAESFEMYEEVEGEENLDFV